MRTKSIVGDLINFRGLVYSPINENGVIFLFGKIAQDMNMYVEEIKPGFPDCIGRRFSGKGWERIDIEFEYLSSNFKDHGHNAKECDVIVCWEHDWPECPVEVIALREVIPNLPNPKMNAADSIWSGGTVSLDALIHKFPVPMADLIEKTRKLITDLSSEIWVNHNGQDFLSFYSPKRVFVNLTVQKKGLQMAVFTRGKIIDGVTPYGYEKGGAKWGRLTIKSDKDLDRAKVVFQTSFNQIKDAISANENTCWFAPLEADGSSSQENEEK